jgi:hypothetical protein
LDVSSLPGLRYFVYYEYIHKVAKPREPMEITCLDYPRRCWPRLFFLRARVVRGCLKELLPHLDQFAHDRRVYVNFGSVVH